MSVRDLESKLVAGMKGSSEKSGVKAFRFAAVSVRIFMATRLANFHQRP